MKRTLFVLALLACTLPAIANSFYFAWNGYGMYTRNNLDLSKSYGAYYYRGVSNGLGLGTLDFYQQVNLYYDRENANVRGSNVRVNANYHFFSPMAVFQISQTGESQVFVTGGVGQIQDGGLLTVNKWQHAGWGSTGNAFDSTYDNSKQLTKYVYRLGFGFTQFMHLKGNFHAFLSEDCGFVIKPITDISTGEYSGLKTNAGYLFSPSYISIHVGVGLITHSKNHIHPCRIYPGDEDPGDSHF